MSQRIVTLHVAMGHGRGVAALTPWAGPAGEWGPQVAQIVELDGEAQSVSEPTYLELPLLGLPYVLDVIETEAGFLVFIGLSPPGDETDILFAVELGPDLAQVGITEVSREYYQPFLASFVRVGDAILAGWSGGGPRPRLAWLDLRGRPTSEVPLPPFGCVSALAAGPEVALALVHSGRTLEDQRTHVLWVDPSAGIPPLMTPVPPTVESHNVVDGTLEDSGLICIDQHVVLATLRDGGFLIDAFGGTWRGDVTSVTPIPRASQGRAFSQLGRGLTTTRATVSAVLTAETSEPLHLILQRWTATGEVEDTARVADILEVGWPVGAPFDLTSIDEARLLVAYANTSTPGPHFQVVTLE
ncbi:MAG: hypothetical protein U0353_29965 [Sandaracinus sp.]